MLNKLNVLYRLPHWRTFQSHTQTMNTRVVLSSLVLVAFVHGQSQYRGAWNVDYCTIANMTRAQFITMSVRTRPTLMALETI